MTATRREWLGNVVDDWCERCELWLGLFLCLLFDVAGAVALVITGNPNPLGGFLVMTPFLSAGWYWVHHDVS